jgi:hypothetical protein
MRSASSISKTPAPGAGLLLPEKTQCRAPSTGLTFNNHRQSGAYFKATETAQRLTAVMGLDKVWGDLDELAKKVRR